jgi:DNA polymerase-1
MANKQPQRIFLIDAMGFIFRAFFAPMERLRSPQGLPTKVPYVMANMLRRLLKDWQPDYVGVVFDVAGPTFRDELFASYKAQRPPMPEELVQQLPYVRRLCEAMRLPILEYQGYEADDVIGGLARQASAQGLEVFLVTSDKDMLQLVRTVPPKNQGPEASGRGPVRVLIPTKDDLLVDEAKVEELLGVPPEKVPDVMALMGDAIDNIPGARDPNEKLPPGERRKAGIGEVGAKQLVQRFGSAEEAIRRADEVEKSGYREALKKYAGFVLLSKRLATIATDVPIALELDRLRRQEHDAEALRALYAELGFTSLLRDLAPAAPKAEGDYAALDSPAALREFLDAVPPGQEVALWLSLAASDREAEGFGSRVAAIELSAEAGSARTAWLDEQGEMLAALRPWLADAARPKIVHDAKLVELLLGEDAGRSPTSSGRPGATSGVAGPPASSVAGMRHATLLYSYLLRPTTSKHSLADAILRQFNVSLAGTPGEHADYLQRLAPALRAEVERQGLADVYEKIDLPLAPVLARMERHGVLVDPQALEKMSGAMEAEIRALEQRIHTLAGVEFNINSPQQLAEILFDKLNLAAPRQGRGRTRAKARSTAADVLEELSGVHPLPAKVIEYREVAKLKSTYVDALPRLIHPETRRLHTSFNQAGTATGRLASSDPNLQNIPVRTELGREIRAAFVAAPGWTLLSADYSQIELRILAHFSEDAVLLEAFRRGEDIHARTAQEVFGVGPMLQTAEHRRAAKVINFGIIYGLSPFGLAQQLGIDTKEAAQFIAAYFARYSGVKAYLDRTLAEVRECGFTRTLFGRTRPIPDINSPQTNLRNFAERTALNTPLQGTAADLIKLAMIEIDRRLVALDASSLAPVSGVRWTPPESRHRTTHHSPLATGGSVARMILQVHDDLLFEVRADALDLLRPLVKDAMENVHPLKVPLVVDIKVGPNWRDMQ